MKKKTDASPRETRLVGAIAALCAAIVQRHEWGATTHSDRYLLDCADRRAMEKAVRAVRAVCPDAKTTGVIILALQKAEKADSDESL